MAETVNPVQSPQPPAYTASPLASASTPVAPSQPSHTPPEIQPAATSSSSISIPASQVPLTPQIQQLPQTHSPAQPPAQSPAMNTPSIQQPQPLTPTTTTTTTTTTINNNQTNTTPSMGYPTRAPPGAPGRNYLNIHLAPYLRTGMTKVLDARPQNPLRYLGEYLITQSLLHEDASDEKGVVDRFLYEEHAAVVRKVKVEEDEDEKELGAGQDQAKKENESARMANGVREESGGEGEGEDETGDTPMAGI